MSENLEQLVLDGYIILAKNGKIERVKAPDFGSVTIKYTNGKPTLIEEVKQTK